MNVNLNYRNKNCLSLLALAIGLLASSAWASTPDFKHTAMPFMEKYCYECHGGKHTKGDLDLKVIKDDRDILKNFKMWRNILQQVNTGEMPPKKREIRPSGLEVDLFGKAIDNSFNLAEAKTKSDPGHVTVRRLNRTEYNNTVRDLVSVDFNPSEDFPADDIGYGFDNIGDVLTISPVHMERYLDAADNIASRALPLTPAKPSNRATESHFLEPFNYRSENSTRPVTNSPPELFFHYKLQKEGEYFFHVRASALNKPGADPIKMTLLLGDKELTTVVVTNEPGRGKSKDFEVKLDLPVGDHLLKARFDNPVPGGDTNRMLFIREFRVVGPSDTRTDFQKKIASIVEGKPEAEQNRDLVNWFVPRAFRRPITKQEADRYVQVMEAAQAGVENKRDAGMQQLIRVVMCSPKFLFRVELDDRPKTRDAHALDEYQLASRLSYFLWNTMPDDELFDLAAKRKLSDNLDAQVERMLRDPKSDTLVENFALQWLQLQRLKTFMPDAKMFPDFDDNLRHSMLRETELFVGEIIHEDRSVLDFVDADYTYVNRTLANLYGLDKVSFNTNGGPGRFRRRRNNDEEFVRVTLPEHLRGGLLTQASVLTVTSNPTRTSPVKRGKWVLEQILGTPPPPPPPNVPLLEAQHELKGTLRQRMEQHRTNPSCANCHQQMDSLGFAMENFDAIGRFRSKDADGPIDPSGVLPDGNKFSGPAELKAILLQKKDLVTHNVVEKLMTYGLGRGLEYYDERAIKKIVTEAAKQDYKFSAVVKGIVKSDPFRLRRGKDLVQKQETSE